MLLAGQVHSCADIVGTLHGRIEHILQHLDVGNGQVESVNLREAFLEREGGDVVAEFLSGSQETRLTTNATLIEHILSRSRTRDTRG